jgi:hypothetical protein
MRWQLFDKIKWIRSRLINKWRTNISNPGWFVCRMLYWLFSYKIKIYFVIVCSLSFRNNYFNNDLRADMYLTCKNEAVWGRKKGHGKTSIYGFSIQCFHWFFSREFYWSPVMLQYDYHSEKIFKSNFQAISGKTRAHCGKWRCMFKHQMFCLPSHFYVFPLMSSKFRWLGAKRL